MVSNTPFFIDNFLQKLYVTSKFGNLNADFIMIVADLSGLKNKI